MAVTLTQDGSVLQFRDAEGRVVIPKKITKAELREHLANLVTKVEQLQQELSAKISTPPPSAGRTGKVEMRTDNPLFAGLPVYQPHSKVLCPTHGSSNANKLGLCTLCFCERARGGRAAA